MGYSEGWTKQSNKLKMKLCSSTLTGAQHRVLNFIDRLTEGFHVRTCSTSVAGIAKHTRLPKRSVRRVLKELKEVGILYWRRADWKTIRVGINHPDTWDLHKHFECVDGDDPRVINRTYEEYEKMMVDAGFRHLLEEDLDDDFFKVEEMETENPDTGDSDSVKGDRKSGLKRPPLKKDIKDKNIKKRVEKEAKEIIEYLNHAKADITGKVAKYKDSKHIGARLREGHTMAQCKHIINVKLNDPWFRENPKYFNPTTMFRPSHFDNYLNEEEFIDPEEVEREKHALIAEFDAEVARMVVSKGTTVEEVEDWMAAHENREKGNVEGFKCLLAKNDQYEWLFERVRTWRESGEIYDYS